MFTQALQILRTDVLLDLADQDFSINLHQHLGLLLLRKEEKHGFPCDKAPLHELLRLCKCIVKLTVGVISPDTAGSIPDPAFHEYNESGFRPERFQPPSAPPSKKQDGLLWVQVQIVKRHLQIALHLFNLFAVYLFKIVVGTSSGTIRQKSRIKVSYRERLCFLLHCVAALPI